MKKRISPIVVMIIILSFSTSLLAQQSKSGWGVSFALSYPKLKDVKEISDGIMVSSQEFPVKYFPLSLDFYFIYGWEINQNLVFEPRIGLIWVEGIAENTGDWGYEDDLYVDGYVIGFPIQGGLTYKLPYSLNDKTLSIGGMIGWQSSTFDLTYFSKSSGFFAEKSKEEYFIESSGSHLSFSIFGGITIKPDLQLRCGYRASNVEPDDYTFNIDLSGFWLELRYLKLYRRW